MARCEVFWEYLGGAEVGIESEVGVCMTNQPDEIEEEKTVPVKVQTNRELVYGRIGHRRIALRISMLRLVEKRRDRLDGSGGKVYTALERAYRLYMKRYAEES